MTLSNWWIGGAQGRICRHWLVAIVICVLLSGCNVELFSELDEKNSNDILLVLNQAGISATKSRAEQGQWAISVGSDRVQDALAIVQHHGLPRAQFVSLGDVFAKEGLIATPAEERQRYAFAVSQELSNTLMQIDGVVVARVHPVIPVIDPLSDRLPTPSAAVFIKHLHDADLAPMVPAIKRLVSQSIEDLEPGDVALTFTAAEQVRMDAGRQSTQTARMEANGLFISGGLALAALAFWPISRLSLRASSHRQGQVSNRKKSSFFAPSIRWQTGLRSANTGQTTQHEGDRWNG